MACSGTALATYLFSCHIWYLEWPRVTSLYLDFSQLLRTNAGIDKQSSGFLRGPKSNSMEQSHYWESWWSLSPSKHFRPFMEYEVDCPVHKIPPRDHNLTQLNPVHSSHRASSFCSLVPSRFPSGSQQTINLSFFRAFYMPTQSKLTIIYHPHITRLTTTTYAVNTAL
jgi:hypothetical protein